jgi:hypothetical protein
LAECAVEARAIEPLYTGVVANFDVLDEGTSCHNDTSTFVSTHERKLGGQWPIAVHSVEICVADTRELDVDKYLIWAWLLDRDLLVLDGCKELVFPR